MLSMYHYAFLSKSSSWTLKTSLLYKLLIEILWDYGISTSAPSLNQKGCITKKRWIVCSRVHASWYWTYIRTLKILWIIQWELLMNQIFIKLISFAEKGWWNCNHCEYIMSDQKETAGTGKYIISSRYWYCTIQISFNYLRSNPWHCWVWWCLPTCRFIPWSWPIRWECISPQW